jgi:DNA-binding Lrp family transcriptional regulator
MSAIEISKQLGMHKTTVHNYLNTLEYMGMVENEHGIWHVKKGEQTIKPLEKEIVIELPLPKNEWQRMVLLEDYAKLFGSTESDNIFKTALEKLKETRTIRITGKNVDNLDLQKIANLIQQANEKSLKVNLKGLLKKLKRSRTNNSSAR